MAIAALPERASAATLEVNYDGTAAYLTIQSAIDAATPGVDDVYVHCGTYVENVVMRDQVNVAGGGHTCSIIDGDQDGSVVSFVDVGAGTTLEGFTIRNGLSGRGGGIYIEASSPTITSNVITGNSAIVSTALTGYGGGIHVRSVAGARSDAAPVIERNVITENSAEQFGGGIDLYIGTGSTIANNLLVANTAEQGGGGIEVYISFPTIVNNTIVRNCLQGAGSACTQGGGGISITDSTGVTIQNNVIAWNEAGGGGGGVDQIVSVLNFAANDTFENLPVNFWPLSWDPIGTNSNISLDPRFVDEEPTFNSYQPRSDSRLLEVAIGVAAPPEDLRGVPRPLDGDVNGTATPDIGARENEGISRLSFVSATELNWDPSRNPAVRFNIYRGDLALLRSSGIYTQDTATVPNARQWCQVRPPILDDTDEPLAGQSYFYLCVPDNSVEGSLGFDSAASERPFTEPNRCP